MERPVSPHDRQIFRQQSLDKLGSPERLDQLLRGYLWILGIRLNRFDPDGVLKQTSITPDAPNFLARN